MSRRLILALIGFAALAGVVLFWMMHGRRKDTVAAAPRLRDQSRYDAAITKPQTVVQHADPRVDESRTPKRSQGHFAGKSHQALSAPTAASQQALPAGSSLERVSSIINAADTDRLYERARAVRAISSPLTQPETEAFSRYLLTPARNSANREYENWLRNEMLDVMVDQPVLPQGFSDMLVTIYSDKQQDIVMRDYAVQHMVPAYELVNSQDQARLQTAMWRATAETDSSLAGTALLALLDIADSRPELGDVGATGRARPPGAPLPATTGTSALSVDSVRLAQTALRLAGDDRCGELARISAVQVCGRMTVEQALPVVQRLAVEAPTMPLRIAATAALGNYALDTKRPESVAVDNLLAQLAESSDPRQTLAAQAALYRLNKQARR